MSLTAKHLRRIYSKRLAMQNDGPNNLGDYVKESTEQLVNELSCLDDNEEIDFFRNGNKMVFIRVLTGDVLAELKEDELFCIEKQNHRTLMSR